LRRLVVLLGLVALALMAATTGSAAQAKQISIDLNDSFQDPDLSAECGVDVFVSFVAPLRVTLVYNRSGLIVREMDHAGNGRVTYRSPDTGKSFSFPIQPSQWNYGSGAVIGSRATFQFVGLFGHVPGLIASDAGLFRAVGVVTGFDEFGIPEVELTEVIAERGNINSGEEITAAICAALT
jgi:hypothetical protein